MFIRWTLFFIFILLAPMQGGIFPFSPNDNYKCPKSLCAAIHKNDYRGVSELLEAGADPNELDPYRKTPLIVAVEKGYREIAFLLLEYGAAVDPKNQSKSPIRIAVEKRFLEIMELLLEYGANVDPENQSESPIEIATEKGFLEIIELLLEHGVSLEGMLHYASSVKTASFLIDKGVDVNAYDSSGRTPLMKARNLQVVELLVDCGADLELRREKGYTVLMQETWCGRCKMVDLLLKKGARVNAKDYLGLTALSIAAEHGEIDVANILISHEANVNARGNTGMTPLMDAAWKGNTKFARFLLDKGGNPHLRTTKPSFFERSGFFVSEWFRYITVPAGSTALDFAKIFSQAGMKEVLLNES